MGEAAFRHAGGVAYRRKAWNSRLVGSSYFPHGRHLREGGVGGRDEASWTHHDSPHQLPSIWDTAPGDGSAS